MGKVKLIKYGYESFIPFSLNDIREFITRNSEDKNNLDNYVIAIPHEKMKYEIEHEKDKYHIYFDYIEYENGKHHLHITKGLFNEEKKDLRKLKYTINSEEEIMFLPLKGIYFGTENDEVLLNYGKNNLNHF